MKFFIAIITLLLILPLAIAVSVTTTPTNSVHGDLVTITATGCEGMAFIRIISPGATMVDAQQGTSPFQMSYNTDSDPSSGTYQAKASCAGETGEATTNFCVDTTCAVETSSPPPPPGNSGGGSRCISRWSCSGWGYCNASLEQARTCTDVNRCKRKKVEVQECTECKESWVCGIWSECQNGKNFRSCIDEHKCGTTKLKPWLNKACTAADPGLAPAPRNQFIPPQPEIQQPESFWSKYKTFIIAIPATLILLILIILLIVHFVPKGRMVYNEEELKEWIKKEQAMGTSNENIKHILAQHTGWREQDIHEAFKELQKDGRRK